MLSLTLNTNFSNILLVSEKKNVFYDNLNNKKKSYSKSILSDFSVSVHNSLS